MSIYCKEIAGKLEYLQMKGKEIKQQYIVNRFLENPLFCQLLRNLIFCQLLRKLIFLSF